MSQYPPNPNPNAYPPQPIPPGGPIGGSMGYAQPNMMATRTSVAAVTSLITGILGCFVITGIIAVITGIVGIQATKYPQVKGRGMAIAGLLLGLLTMLMSLGFAASMGGLGYWAYKTQIKPAMDVSVGMVDAVNSGDTDKAMQFVDESAVSRDHIQQIIDELKPLGKPTGFKPTMRQANNNNGFATVDLGGVLQYPNNVSKAVSVQLSRQPGGTYKITKLDVE